MHAGGSFAEALCEHPEVLAVQCRAVIFGVVEPRKRLADGRLPERQLAIMLAGGDAGHVTRTRRQKRTYYQETPARNCVALVSAETRVDPRLTQRGVAGPRPDGRARSRR